MIRGCHCKWAQEESSFDRHGLGSGMAQPLHQACLLPLPSRVKSGSDLGADGITGTFTTSPRGTGATESLWNQIRAPPGRQGQNGYKTWPRLDLLSYLSIINQWKWFSWEFEKAWEDSSLQILFSFSSSESSSRSAIFVVWGSNLSTAGKNLEKKSISIFSITSYSNLNGYCPSFFLPLISQSN